jgi:prepilin-type N-terminal cleavage/methylation domain-containing protein
MAQPSSLFRGRRWHSFTLIELLVVILIIGILAALTLAAAEAVMTKGARSRASVEMQAMTSALESYKADNAIYPPADTFPSGTNEYATDDVVATTNYEGGSMLLFQALSGKTNFSDAPITGVTKTYMNFKAGEVANTTTGSGNSYVEDPWGYSYGYYTGDTPANGAAQLYPPYSGTGFFDLWTTGGSTVNTSGGYTNTWISNWSPQ